MCIRILSKIGAMPLLLLDGATMRDDDDVALLLGTTFGTTVLSAGGVEGGGGRFESDADGVALADALYSLLVAYDVRVLCGADAAEGGATFAVEGSM